jgi:hypothetical protein
MARKAKIVTEYISVSPALARQWLMQNTNNRHMREDIAHRYAKDMAEGRWQVSHQGLAFYEDGTLADGQHRLFAVTVYNKPVTFLVTRNVPRLAAQMIDQHIPRQAHDAIQIAGGESWIDRNIVAIARVLLGNMGSDVHQKSVAQIQEYIEQYSEPLRFAHSLATQRRRFLTTAAITACYFCAEQAGESRDKIKRFGEIMAHGEINGPQENAAIRLREYLLQAGGGAWIGAGRLETAKKVQRAIQLFCRGQPIAKLMQPEKLIYPIPQ